MDGGGGPAGKAGTSTGTTRLVRILLREFEPELSRFLLTGPASALLARNHFNFLSPFIGTEEGDGGTLALKDDDVLVKGIRLTQGGRVVHPNYAEKEG